MADLIDRRAALDALGDVHPLDYNAIAVRNRIKGLPSTQPESLTDKEQRIFLAAMERERKVCRQVDEECRNSREPYEDSLVHMCNEIERKVKGALWI